MPSARTSLISLGAGLLWLCAVGQARAQGPLRWVAPAGCPDAPAVRGRAVELLGRAAGEVALEAEVTVRGDLYELTARGAEGGLRSLSAPDCESLAEAAALIAAMAIDPEAVGERLSVREPDARPARGQKPLGALLASPARSLATATTAVASLAAEPSRASAAAGSPDGRDGDAADLAWSLSLGARGDVGVLPGASLGPTVGAALALGILRIDARAFLSVARETGPENHAPARASVALYGGEARACAALIDGAAALGPCAGIAIAAMHAEGRGVSSPGASTAVWSAVTVGGTVAVPVAGWLALRGDVEALVATQRPAFVVGGISGVVFEPSALGGSASLALEARFR